MRWGRWLNRTLLWPLFAGVMLLLLLLFTQPGLRFSVWLVDGLMDDLSIRHSEGAWLSGVTLQDIRYQNANLEANVASLSLRLQKRCLIQLRLCIPELKLVGATLTLQPAAPSAALTEPEQAQSAALSNRIILPIPMRVESLVLEDISFQSPSLSVNWQRFSVAVEAWGNRVRLNQGRWQALSINLPPSAEPTEPLSAYLAPVLPEISLPLAVYLEDFQLTALSLTQGVWQQQLSKLSFSAQLAQRSIRLLDVSAEHAEGKLQLSANLRLQDNYPLQAQLDATLTHGVLAGQRAQLQLSGDLAKLAVDFSANGPLTADLQAQLALLSDDLPVTLQLQSERLDWPVQNPELTLKKTALNVNGNLSKLNLTLQTGLETTQFPRAELSLNGAWHHWQQLASIEQFAISTLGGEIQINGQLSFKQQLQWQLAAALQQIQPGLHWPDFPGVIQGSIENSGQLLADGSVQLTLPELQIQGDIRGQPIDLTGSLLLASQADGKQWQADTPGLTFSHGQNQLKVQGSLAEQWQLDGELALPNLAHSYPGLLGAVAGKVALRGPALTPTIEFLLNANNLDYQDYRLETAKLEGMLSLAKPVTSSINLEVRRARYLRQTLQSLVLRITGTELAHQLQLAMVSEPLNAELILTGNLVDRSVWQARFEHLLLDTPVGPWQLSAPLPIALNIQQQEVALSAHCWQQAPSSLCLTQDTTLALQQTAVDLQLTNYQLAQLNPLLPYHTTVEGAVNMVLAIDWQQGMPLQARAELDGRQGHVTQQLDGPVTLNWHDLAFFAELGQHQLRSQLDVRLAEAGQLHAQALLTDLDKKDKPLRSEITLKHLTLDFLRPLLDEYSELAGTLSSQLSLSGHLTDPQIAGELRLDALKIKGKLAPTDIENADLLVNFTGEQARLTGKVTTPEGTLALNGDANWQELDNWQAALQVKGDELKLQIPQALLYLKPDVQITASPGRSKIAGLVQIPRASITVDSLPQNAVGISADQVLLNRRLEPIAAEQARLFTLETDIRVQLGEQVRLSAFGLKTRLNGELRVQQQQFNPTVRGEVSLQDGTFRAYGQDLLIRQGKMTFSGLADQPFLNVEAIRNPANMEDDVIAGIRVTGPADQPIITIFSEPSKPQANALSYLIMGRDLDSESGNAANSVTTSLIGMSIASSGKLVGELGEVFGVSDLTLDTEGAGDNSQVTVSGYLTRDLQLKYGIGIFQPIGQFTLRYRLMRSLFLEAVSGLDNAVDLLYKFEFD